MRRFLFLAIAALLCSYAVANAQSLLVNNAGSTGTTINHLAKYTGAPVTAVITATTDISLIQGIVVGGAGTTGVATIAQGGVANCIFDANGVTAGHYVVNSPVTAGDCADGGVSPSGAQSQIIGFAQATVASGSAAVSLIPPAPPQVSRVALSWTSGQNLSALAIPISRVGNNGGNLIGIACRPEVVVGGTATIAVWMAPSGTALASGTKLNTTDCNANINATTEQALGNAVVPLTINNYIGIVATGGGWVSSTGSGVIQITYSN